MIVFVPTTRAAAAALRAGGPTSDPVRGWTATPGLRAAYEVADEEEADFLALTHAEAAAVPLAVAGEGRVVLAVELTTAHARVADDATGAVEVTVLAWDDVQAVYLDEPDAVAAVDALAVALTRATDRARSVIDDPDVRDLVAEHDLLWHLPDELPGPADH